MFVKEGWSSPYSFFRRLYSIEHSMDGSSSAESYARAEASFKKLMEGAKYGGILLSNGDVVSIDDSFLSRVTRNHPFTHAYFNFETGEVGTVDSTWRKEIVQDLSAAKERLMTRNFRILVQIKLVSVILCAILYFSIYIFLGLDHVIRVVDPLMPLLVIFPFLTAIFILIFSIAILSALSRTIAAKRRAKISCRAYAGGHLILPEQVYEEFVRKYYGAKPVIEVAGGRPRHPAHDWYAERGFHRNGMSMKELQSEMPVDDNGKPPSETTIRAWESENLQRKPPAETFG